MPISQSVKINNFVWEAVSLPISHNVPIQRMLLFISVGHVQVNLLTPSTHVPPFVHGLLSHSLISVEERHSIKIARKSQILFFFIMQGDVMFYSSIVYNATCSILLLWMQESVYKLTPTSTSVSFISCSARTLITTSSVATFRIRVALMIAWTLINI